MNGINQVFKRRVHKQNTRKCFKQCFKLNFSEEHADVSGTSNRRCEFPV